MPANPCTYHPDFETVKVEIRPQRFTYRCAGCEDEALQQQAEIEAELGYERSLEDAGWRDAMEDRDREAMYF